MTPSASRLSVSPEEARETAKIVGLAALKYGDLSNQATKDYVFDIERFTSFEGNTGPYILYTIARINSILKKYEAVCGTPKDPVILPPEAEPLLPVAFPLPELPDFVPAAAALLAARAAFCWALACFSAHSPLAMFSF